MAKVGDVPSREARHVGEASAEPPTVNYAPCRGGPEVFSTSVFFL